MPIDLNGQNIGDITLNGNTIGEVTVNGQNVFSAKKSGEYYYLIEFEKNKELLYFDLNNPFDIANKGNADFVLSTQDRPTNMDVTNDGASIYIAARTDGSPAIQIEKYDMSSPFDLSTAIFDTSLNLVVSLPSQNVTCFEFADAGNKFYQNDGNGNILQFDLAAPYDIPSASQSASLAGNTSVGPGDVAFRPDGLKVSFGHRSDNNIVTFDLSTPFDIGTASNKKSFGTPDDDPSCLKWNADGTTAFVRHASPDMVNQFDTTTPYSVDGMSFVGQVFNNPGFADGGHEFNANY